MKANSIGIQAGFLWMLVFNFSVRLILYGRSSFKRPQKLSFNLPNFSASEYIVFAWFDWINQIISRPTVKCLALNSVALNLIGLQCYGSSKNLGALLPLQWRATCSGRRMIIDPLQKYVLDKECTKCGRRCITVPSRHEQASNVVGFAWSIKSDSTESAEHFCFVLILCFLVILDTIEH